MFVANGTACRITKLKVTKITPSGQIVCDNVKFDQKGWRIGFKNPFGCPFIIEPRKDVIESFERDRLVSEITNSMSTIKKMSIEQLKEIIKVIKQGEKK